MCADIYYNTSNLSTLQDSTILGLIATSFIISRNYVSTPSNTLVSSGNYDLISSEFIKILTRTFQFF